MTYKSHLMYDVFYYITAKGDCPFQNWLDHLKEISAVARVTIRIDRLMSGNFGDCKPIDQGVWELRIHSGPGYRVYY